MVKLLAVLLCTISTLSWSSVRSAADRSAYLTAVGGADTVMPSNAIPSGTHGGTHGGKQVATPRQQTGNSPVAPRSQTVRKPVAPPALHLYLTGTYTDCNGNTPLKAGLWRDSCLTGIYLVSHNTSTGAKFFALHVGSKVIYGHTWTVWKVYRIAASSWSQPAGPLILQTCTDNSGRTYLIVELK